MPCGGPFPSRRRAGSPITFLFTRRHCSPALTWPASTALLTNWRTRRFLLPGSALDRDRPRRQSAALCSRVGLPAAQGRPCVVGGNSQLTRGDTSPPPSHLRVHSDSDESASVVPAADGRCRHGIRIRLTRTAQRQPPHPWPAAC